jgi:acyl-CoA-binding protein
MKTMSTTPVVVAPNPIQQGVALYEKRILPAKLDDSKKDEKGQTLNGLFFGRYLFVRGINASTLSPQQISDLLYQATIEDCEKEKPGLIWSIAPKALTKRAGQKGPNTRQDTREVSAFEDRVNAGKEAAKKQKAQEQAKAEALEIVNNFQPLNHRTGRPNYTLQSEKKVEWNKRIAGYKGDFIALVKELRAEINRLHVAAEKAAERI